MSSDSDKPVVWPPVSELIKARTDDTEILYLLDSWGTVANAYKQSADELARLVIEAEPHDSPLVFPMLFAYRHYAELCVKDLIHVAGWLLDEPLNATDLRHDFDYLLSRLGPVLPKDIHELRWQRSGDIEPDPSRPSLGQQWELFQDWCERFAQADEMGMRYRYPVRRMTKQEKASLESRLTRLDIAVRKRELKKLVPYDFPMLKEELQVTSTLGLLKVMVDFDEAYRDVGMLIAAMRDAKAAIA
jgi:hypothetical protein